MTNRTTRLLIMVVASFAAGDLAADDFAKGLKNIENQVRANKPGIAKAAVPGTVSTAIASSAGSDRWWSVNFFGSGHKGVMAAALAFIAKDELPDMNRAKDILLLGANDESGHFDPKDNGGKTDELWYGKTPFSRGGVLWNYQHFKFQEAYARLAAICHLTQDQAVPTHAANLYHYTNDGFEGFAANGNSVKITASRDDGEMEPYEYYQDLQDDTRRHLVSWVNPRTGNPYWVPAKDAPPLGQDATFGPRGGYGPDGDAYTHTDPVNADGGNNNTQITDSPEIRTRQLAMAGAATVGVLKSASKRLPPLVSGLIVTSVGRSAVVKFTVLDNRSRYVVYSVDLYRDGKLFSTPVTEQLGLTGPASSDLMLKGEVSLQLNSSTIDPGNYILQVRVTDSDHNTIPEEVNTDGISTNDTRASLTLH